jgi:hypothetical protein
MNKRTVRYSTVEPGIKATVGRRYQLYPVDHTSMLVSNTNWCSTSPVVSVDIETGRIETMNSIYMPQDKKALRDFKTNNT